MPAKSEKPLERICARVFADDMDHIRKIANSEGVGQNRIIREIISKYVTHSRALERQKLDQITRTKIDIEIPLTESPEE